MKNLGTIGFRNRKSWSANTFFRQDDRVKVGRGWAYATEDHDSGESFEADMAAGKWEWLVDAQGLEDMEATVEAAKEATEQATSATEAASKATEQAKEVTAETKEATEVLTQSITPFENDEFIYGIADLLGNLLFGIKRSNGACYQPKGTPEEVAEQLAAIRSQIEVLGLSAMENDDYLFAITDKEGNVLFGLNKKGAAMVNAISGICTVEQFDSNEFVYAVLDSVGNLLFGVKNDGTFYMSKFSLPSEILEQLKNLNQYISEDESDMEFLYKIQDKDGLVLFGLDYNGKMYAPKGVPAEVRKELDEHDNRLSAIEEKFATFRGGAGDWSDEPFIKIPIPKLAIVNLITDYPLHNLTKVDHGGTPGVNCELPVTVEFWDMQGNYFRSKSLLSAQGNSSMSFMKKNFAFDLLMSDGEDREIQFGDWVAQSGFHMKSYYTDAFRGRGAVSYMLYEEMAKTRPFNDDRPYKYLFAGNYGTTSQGLKGENSDLDENFETGAKCFPQAFPIIILQNNEFYGVYSFQLKKHRDNFQMSRKKVKHIHLDGTLGADQLWLANGDTTKIGWTGFEVRNPNPKAKDWTMIDVNGNDYDGDFPKELLGSDSELYDKNNDSHKNTAKVKDSILLLSTRIAELKAKEAELQAKVAAEEMTSDEMVTAMRELIATYFMPSFMVDYILETNLVADGDGYAKNWQWTTWDGVLWTANPYDHDGVIGAFHIGQWQSEPSAGWFGNNLNLPSGWIIKYYLPELKERWQSLRDASIFNARHITSLLRSWLNRVGFTYWEMEFTKWDESPCNRASNINEDYWSRSTSYITGWATATVYAKNGTASRGGRVWKSLVANNTGIDPLEDDGTNWEDVTWDETKEYAAGDVAYYGKSLFYGFKCLQACTGEAPITKFYNEERADGITNHYPQELGSYDSIYRVYNWLVKRIENMDTLLDYTPSTAAELIEALQKRIAAVEGE